jgi:hypothetical protein
MSLPRLDHYSFTGTSTSTDAGSKTKVEGGDRNRTYGTLRVKKIGQDGHNRA